MGLRIARHGGVGGGKRVVDAGAEERGKLVLQASSDSVGERVALGRILVPDQRVGIGQGPGRDAAEGVAQLGSDAVTQVGTPPPAEAVRAGCLPTITPDKALTQG